MRSGVFIQVRDEGLTNGTADENHQAGDGDN